jgi:predicted RNA-binding Zn ribbon-like protein
MQHIPTTLDHGFEYIGGDLSADFTNTRSGRYDEAPGHEHIQTYADLVEFSRQAGALRPSEAKRLLAGAESRPEKATQIHRRGVALREAIWRAFARIAQEKDPAREDVELIGEEAADAGGHYRLVKASAGFGWEWPETDDLARPLWPIARAAADVLTSEADRAHLRECADDTCAWLFVDRTKNHSRRWCDMNTCGSRNKVRDFRARRASGRKKSSSSRASGL